MKSTFRYAAVALMIGIGATLAWQARHHSVSATAIPSGTASSQLISPSPVAALESVTGSPAETAIAPEPIKSTAVSDSAQSLIAQIEQALSTGMEADWERVLNILFPALMAKDRMAAARVVQNFVPGEKREQLLRRLARNWAAADFSGAVSWIAGLPGMAEQKAAFEDACFAVIDSDPAEAVHAWETLNFSADDHILENLVQGWAGKDLASAQAWVTSRPPSLQRDQAVARIAYVMAQSKPAEAAAFVMQEITAGPARTEAAISVLHQWALRDSAGAIAWASNFTDEALREKAIGELTGVARDR